MAVDVVWHFAPATRTPAARAGEQFLVAHGKNKVGALVKDHPHGGLLHTRPVLQQILPLVPRKTLNLRGFKMPVQLPEQLGKLTAS